jgi:hypothetical protein
MSTPGTNSKFSLDDGAGALTEITSKERTVKLNRTIDQVDDHTLGASSKSHAATLKDGTFSLDGVWDAAIDAILDSALVAAPTTRSFSYDPTGAATPVFTGECFCSAYDISTDVAGILVFSATLQVTGGVTRT